MALPLCRPPAEITYPVVGVVALVVLEYTNIVIVLRAHLLCTCLSNETKTITKIMFFFLCSEMQIVLTVVALHKNKLTRITYHEVINKHKNYQGPNNVCS